jgi:hypothetical protein
VRSKVGNASNSVALHLDVGTEHLTNERLEPAQLDNKQLILGYPELSNWMIIQSRGKDPLFTAKFPRAALAARCTSVSWLERRKRMGSSVSRPTGRTSFSVISAKASAALRWRSTLSEKESVVNAESGEPLKKLVVVRS